MQASPQNLATILTVQGRLQQSKDLGYKHHETSFLTMMKGKEVKLEITTAHCVPTHHASPTQKLNKSLTLPKSIELTINKPAWQFGSQGLDQVVRRQEEPEHVTQGASTVSLTRM